jgi:hypothetical protein
LRDVIIDLRRLQGYKGNQEAGTEGQPTNLKNELDALLKEAQGAERSPVKTETPIEAEVKPANEPVNLQNLTQPAKLPGSDLINSNLGFYSGLKGLSNIAEANQRLGDLIYRRGIVPAYNWLKKPYYEK